VSQKRLVINLSEILHLEIDCGFCGKPSILLLEEQEQSKIQIGPETRISLNACPYCRKPFTEMGGLQTAVDKIREGLKFRSPAQSKAAIRLVIQQ
jgi:hypothetical protein